MDFCDPKSELMRVFDQKSRRRQTDASYRWILISTWNKTDFQTPYQAHFSISSQSIQSPLEWAKNEFESGFVASWDQDVPVAGTGPTFSRFLVENSDWFRFWTTKIHISLSLSPNYPNWRLKFSNSRWHFDK